MSALISTKKTYRHFFLLLSGFVTKNSSAEKSAEKNSTEKSAEKKSAKKSTKKSTKKSAEKHSKKKHKKICGPVNEPCKRVNELSAPCNQTLPSPTGNFSVYEVTSYGNGALCNCNKLYYDTLETCTYCLSNSSRKVTIQRLSDWRASCMKFGTQFTEFPPSQVMPYSELDSGNSTNSTKIVPLTDPNNITIDILIAICVIETVLIIAGIGFYIFYRKYYRKNLFESKELNESKTDLQNDIANIPNIDNQLEQHELFQQFLQYLQSQNQTGSQRLLHDETIPI
ncbi:8712_t:CDS:2 [Dentiscutata erythropus]|uniref:8712_t:CDS:1 n=1 Tax=Dentiscutata erythropus TaxID=1348616 RepID=A0A9N9CW22_9GLOM|nr:8712_t:CDS:2 [Dentiscutata erythropus]